MNDSEEQPQIRVERPLYQKDQLREQLRYEHAKKKLFGCCSEKPKFKGVITKLVPLLGWLPKYDWKGDATSDLIAGITCAIMHIPQGMAYALLGNVPPVVGIYMAVFPIFIYVILGTSRHNSMGTFSIACLMTGKAVLEHSDPVYLKDNLLDLQGGSNSTSTPTGYTPVQVATAVTFVSALVQLAMYFLQLGAASALLSDTLVNSFTTGAAVQVITTQIKDLLGLSIPKFKGYFVTVNTVIAIVENFSNVNYAAILISVISILIISFNNEVLKPIVAKKTSIPIPIELIAVVSGTVISQYFFLRENYAIKAVGEIPTGLPEPTLPPFSLLPDVLVDGLTTAIVSYTISLSLALILAQKADYEVDANQELLAMGGSNIVGSLFSCMPVCASLSRSMIQLVVGGKTQIVSLVASSLLVVILLWLGPFFEPLPRCVLASVIVVSLKGMLMQTKDFLRFWRLSKLDGATWILTFLTVTIVGIDIGLLVGIAMSLVSIFIFSFKPYTCLLGGVPHTELYLDVNKYKGTREIEGIKLFHYSGGLNFATKNIFRDELYKLIDLNPQKEYIYRKKLASQRRKVEDNTKSVSDKKMTKLSGKVNLKIKCIIMDFSSVSYIDPSGVSMLKNVIESFRKLDIFFYIAGCSDRVYNLMEKCEFIPKDKGSKEVKVFTSVHDAVECACFNLGIRPSEGNGFSRVT